MVEAFGGWNLCPSGRLRQKKRTIWHQTFHKSRSGEESAQTPLALSCLRCSYSIAGLLVSFSFPRLMSCASTRLNLNTWMAFKNDLTLSLFRKISLNEQRAEGNVRNVSHIFVYDAVISSSDCFFNFKSSIHDRVRHNRTTETRGLKLNNSSEATNIW